MALDKDDLAAIIAGVTAQLAPATTQAPAASAAPAVAPWIAEGKAAQSAKAKAAKTQAVKPVPHYVVTRSSFKEHAGYSIVKMFGDKPSSFRPQGKFVTEGEAQALRNFKG